MRRRAYIALSLLLGALSAAAIAVGVSDAGLGVKVASPWLVAAGVAISIVGAFFFAAAWLFCVDARGWDK